jgi:hypothetical protein
VPVDFERLPGGTPDRSAADVEVASRSAGPVVTHYAAVTIGRGADTVARYVFDPTTMPHWSGVLFEIDPTDDLEPRLGRNLRANLKILGVRLAVEGELIEVDLAARRAAVRILPVDGDGSLEHRLWVEKMASADGSDDSDNSDNSVLHFWNRVELPSWLSGNVSDALVRRFLDHTASFALANIKDILELGEEDDVRRLGPVAGRRQQSPSL